MAGLFDVDLIPKILSVDKKVRLSGLDKRHERRNGAGREDRSKRPASSESDDADSEKQGTIDITV